MVFFPETNQYRPVQDEQFSQPSQQLEILRPLLAEPKAGSTIKRSQAMPAASAASRRREAPAGSGSSGRRSAGLKVVHDHRRDAVAGHDKRQLGSFVNPRTSLIIDAPAAIAASATAALLCRSKSALEHAELAIARMTGTTRSISRAASTGSCPGLVDSPPTSMMPAPCS